MAGERGYDSEEEEALAAEALKARLKMSPREAFLDDLWRTFNATREPMQDFWRLGFLRSVPESRARAYALCLVEFETSVVIFWRLWGSELMTLGAPPDLRDNLPKGSINHIRVTALHVASRPGGYDEALAWLRENVPALLAGPIPRGKLTRSFLST